MSKPPKTNFARISSWGPDGVRMNCEGGPLWVLEMAAMQLTDAVLERLIRKLEVMKTMRAERANQAPVTVDYDNDCAPD